MAGFNPHPVISAATIHKLLASSIADIAELKTIYGRLPNTRCERKTHCCAMLPESTILEALTAFNRLRQEPAALRQRTLKKMVAYFFVNPAQITACPFLVKKQCVIYEDRFFGCRSYGLWSPQHYEKMARENRRMKSAFRLQWQRLGISLPDEVIDFQQPYCLDVTRIHGTDTDDKALVRLASDIEALSSRLSPWHQAFSRSYFADLSFLTSAMIFDVDLLLKMKVEIVREYVSTGTSKLLNDNLEDVSDFFS
ncbi:hypothetical protein JY97_14180 [Alkalispirochaeta odontotermitis]|nr:hypothetical protein JY97_14180 [Alkalispirochaeta odontotermitis]CAB1078022.1 hypothetical protein D1AOALGA4SA_5788 [Olavius algarvensis Delta 1 endosymbiont]